MSAFEIHTLDSAPAESVPLLEQVRRTTGFVPNLIAVLAESPVILESYLSLLHIFDKSSLDPVQRQIVILAISRMNECDYCMAAHSVSASMQDVPAGIVRAIRDDQPISNAKLEALRRFTELMVAKRGWLAEGELADFRAAGFTNAQILDVIVATSLKTISNYANHIAETTLDASFSSHVWQPLEKPVA